MANPNGRKGSQWATEARDYLRSQGFTVEKLVPEGSRDRGDLIVFERPDIVWELKNTKTIDLAGTLKEAKKEAENAGAPYYLALHKRRNHSAAQAYVTMPLEVFVAFLKEES